MTADLSDLIAARRRPRQETSLTQYEKDVLAEHDARIAALRAQKQEYTGGDEYWRIEGELVAAELERSKFEDHYFPKRHKIAAAQAEMAAEATAAMRTAKKTKATPREAAIAAAVEAERRDGRMLKVILGAVNKSLSAAGHKPTSLTKIHGLLKP